MKTIKLITFIIGFSFMSTAHAASLSLEPAEAVFNPNCHNVVHIYADTKGSKTHAIDAFLEYNQDEIQFIDQLSNKKGVQIFPIELYQAYPGNVVTDEEIRYTGFNDADYFQGEGRVASLVFKAKRNVESTSINFQFKEGETRDSNVANTDSKDVLKEVQNGVYTFDESGECSDDIYPQLINGVFESDNGLKGASRSIYVPNVLLILFVLLLLANIIFFLWKNMVCINFDVQRISKRKKVVKKSKK